MILSTDAHGASEYSCNGLCDACAILFIISRRKMIFQFDFRRFLRTIGVGCTVFLMEHRHMAVHCRRYTNRRCQISRVNFTSSNVQCSMFIYELGLRYAHRGMRVILRQLWLFYGGFRASAPTRSDRPPSALCPSRAEGGLSPKYASLITPYYSPLPGRDHH